jgi:hypothetical protein
MDNNQFRCGIFDFFGIVFPNFGVITNSETKAGNPFAEALHRLSLLLTPKRKTIPFAIVNLIHCRRVRRRDLLANSERSPTL